MRVGYEVSRLISRLGFCLWLPEIRRLRTTIGRRRKTTGKPPRTTGSSRKRSPHQHRPPNPAGALLPLPRLNFA